MSRVDAQPVVGKKHRIFVVDDHQIPRQALVMLLAKEPLFEVCGDSEGESEAIQRIEACDPDLVVVGISSKNCMNGLRLLSEIKERNPNRKTLIWLMMENNLIVERALRAGASGYLSKEEPFEQVVDAIDKVLRDSTFLSPLVVHKLMEHIHNGKLSAADSLQNLSVRELEVFDMIGHGMTTQQIATKLQISPKTVETHRTRIKQKLDIKNSAQLNYRATLWAIDKE
jgi:RNA polymerase sigma factor (sigma-70 family)